MLEIERLFEKRLRRELSALRAELDGTAPLTAKGEQLEQVVETPVRHPAAWTDADGIVRSAAGAGHDDAKHLRAATCCEVLDALEHGIPELARSEARAMNLCVAAFIASDNHRDELIVLAVDRWPWSRPVWTSDDPQRNL